MDKKMEQEDWKPEVMKLGNQYMVEVIVLRE
jgi:hypothetical protein